MGDPNITADLICSSGDFVDWNEIRNQKRLSLKLIRQEIKTKKIISKTLASGIDDFVEKDMTPREFCDSLEKKTENSQLIGTVALDRCMHLQRNFQKNLTSTIYSDKPYASVCRDLYPKIKQFRLQVIDCENSKAAGFQAKDVGNKRTQAPHETGPSIQKKNFRYLIPRATPQ